MADGTVSANDVLINISLANGSAAKVKFPGCEDVVDVLTLLQDNAWVTAHDMTFVKEIEQRPPRVFLNTAQIITFAVTSEIE